jgi:hypothetical protein
LPWWWSGTRRIGQHAAIADGATDEPLRGGEPEFDSEYDRCGGTLLSDSE